MRHKKYVDAENQKNSVENDFEKDYCFEMLKYKILPA